MKFIIRLIIVITWITFINCFNRKHTDTKTITNSEKYLNYVDIYNTTDNTSGTSVDLFHKMVNMKKFEGIWTTNSESHITGFERESGLLSISVKIFKISKNGREINFRFIISDGFYRNNWMVVDQAFLYFNENDSDSDIIYQFNNNVVKLTNKGNRFRGSEIRCNKLYNHYIKYGKFY